MNTEPNMSQEADINLPAISETAPERPLPALFNTTTMEKVIAWLAIPVAFLYVQFLWSIDAFEDAQILRAKIFLMIFVSGFIAAGKLFETVFGLPFQYAIFLGAGSVVF